MTAVWFTLALVCCVGSAVTGSLALTLAAIVCVFMAARIVVEQS